MTPTTAPAARSTSRRGKILSIAIIAIVSVFLFLRYRSTDPNVTGDAGVGNATQVASPQIVLKDEDRLRQDILAGMALATGQPFPSSVPWAPMHEIASKGLYPLEALLVYHPVLFLEMCLQRYERDVQGYTATLVKQESVGGKLQSLEKVSVAFREHPFSVYMKWLEGGSGITAPGTVLYVKGENDNKLLARGRSFASVVGIFTKDIHGDEARSTGRYTVDQFGIFLGAQRTVASMRKAKERGTLHVRYEGQFKVPELGDRVCYKFVRTPYVPLEDEGLNELTIYIDKETWLQTGSVLHDPKGNLIADYFFRDVQINPQFKKDQFTRGAV